MVDSKGHNSFDFTLEMGLFGTRPASIRGMKTRTTNEQDQGRKKEMDFKAWDEANKEQNQIEKFNRNIQRIVKEELVVAIPKKKKEKIKVVCMECGKKFSTGSMLPTCPKCKGGDIEVQ